MTLQTVCTFFSVTFTNITHGTFKFVGWRSKCLGDKGCESAVLRLFGVNPYSFTQKQIVFSEVTKSFPLPGGGGG